MSTLLFITRVFLLAYYILSSVGERWHISSTLFSQILAKSQMGPIFPSSNFYFASGYVSTGNKPSRLTFGTCFYCRTTSSMGAKQTIVLIKSFHFPWTLVRKTVVSTHLKFKSLRFHNVKSNITSPINTLGVRICWPIWNLGNYKGMVSHFLVSPNSFVFTINWNDKVGLAFVRTFW